MRLLFLIAIAFAGYLIYKLYFKQLLAQGKAGQIKLALIVLGLFFLVMAVTGRAHALFAIIGAAMTQVMRLAPLIIRFMPSLQKYLGGAIGGAAGGAGAAGTSQSKVRTKTLVATLDHVSGKMDGEIIEGVLSGRRLSDLSLNELKQYYQDCKESDPEAVRILQAYIARERSDWDDAPGEQDSNTDKLPSDAISIREAFDILGLEQGATKKEITKAHRSLMAQLHPDKGGSNYLAAKVNEAKKVLLAHVTED